MKTRQEYLAEYEAMELDDKMLQEIHDDLWEHLFALSMLQYKRLKGMVK